MALGEEDIEKLGLIRAIHAQPRQERLTCGLPEVDDFLDGGLPAGVISEWGLPLGFGSRRIILHFLKMATRTLPTANPMPVLWIYAATPLYVFPPTWAAYGVDLAHVGFVRTDDPIRDLKPAFLDSYYRVFVFDLPLTLRRDDLAFLARQARLHQSFVLVLRNQLLQEDRGNVWARLRINISQDPLDAHHLKLTPLRGLSPRCLRLAPASLEAP